MSDPFRQASDATSVGDSSSGSPFQVKPFRRGRPLRRKEQTPEVKKTRGFFGKLFGAPEPSEELAAEPVLRGVFSGAKMESEATPIEEIEEKISSPTSNEEAEFTLPRKETDSEKLRKRHEELLQALGSTCEALKESRSQAVEVRLSEVLPPMPTENLEALAKTQFEVSESLGKMVSEFAEVGRREGQMVSSLGKIDLTLGQLNRSNERTLTTMDEMKGVFARVSESMDTMQNGVEISTQRYERLCKRLGDSEKENLLAVTKLQKQMLGVTRLIGGALVICVLVLIFR